MIPPVSRSNPGAAAPHRPIRPPGQPQLAATGSPSPITTEMRQPTQHAQPTLANFPGGLPPLVSATTPMQPGTPPSKSDPNAAILASEMLSDDPEERIDLSTEGTTRKADYTASPGPTRPTPSTRHTAESILPTYGPALASGQLTNPYRDPYGLPAYSPSLQISTTPVVPVTTPPDLYRAHTPQLWSFPEETLRILASAVNTANYLVNRPILVHQDQNTY